MPTRNFLWILLIAAAAVVAVVVLRSNSGPQQIPPDQFRPMGETLQLIVREYYHDVDAQALQVAAVSGMVQALDEFSSHVSPQAVKAFTERVQGTQRGLGLRWHVVEGRVVARAPAWGSPAQHAGLAAGDELLMVDETRLVDLNSQEIARLLQGPADGGIDLVIRRPGGEIHRVSLRPAAYDLQSVEGLVRMPDGRWEHAIGEDGGLAYIRCSEFTRHTVEQFREAMGRMGQVDGLILDLRDNPGGMLPSAIELTDLLVRRGTIVTVRRRGGADQRYEAREGQTLPEVPLVILVNAQTASAAEIVAGAADFHARGVVLGTRTRGKGCIQSMHSLPGNLGQMNLTTSEFVIGTCRRILRQPGSDQWGVDPRVEQVLPISHVQRLEELREDARAGGRSPRTASDSAEAGDVVTDLLALDTQLARALEILRHPQEYAAALEQASQEARRCQEAHAQATRARTPPER